MNPYVLISPVITEKSLFMAKENNAYTFFVDKNADKRQIRAAIELAYGVTVRDLKTVTLPSGEKRTGKKRIRTNTASRKKAIAVLPEGQKIAVFEM